MIKVIFVDTKDGEVQTVEIVRLKLRNDTLQVGQFYENVHRMAKQFVDKLIKEPQED